MFLAMTFMQEDVSIQDIEIEILYVEVRILRMKV